MSYFKLLEKPDVPIEYLVMSFAGWPDAGESATASIKYLMRRLGATKFAEIDPEEFYDFSQERPPLQPNPRRTPTGSVAVKRVFLLGCPE